MTPNKTLLALFCVLLLCLTYGECAPCQPAKSAPLVSIPFEYDPLLHSDITLQVSVDNKAPLTFIFDTGCDLPVALADWAANELKIPRSSTYFHGLHLGAIQSTSIKTISFFTSKNQSFTVKTDKLIAGILDEKYLSNIYGNSRLDKIEAWIRDLKWFNEIEKHISK